MRDPRTDVLRMLVNGADSACSAVTSAYGDHEHFIDPTYDTWDAIAFWADLIDAFVAWGEAIRDMLRANCGTCDSSSFVRVNGGYQTCRECFAYRNYKNDCPVCRGTGLR